jgi:hypothetical protein
MGVSALLLGLFGLGGCALVCVALVLVAWALADNAKRKTAD